MTDVRINHPTGLHNFSVVYIGDIVLAFSYSTIVGFYEGWEWTVSENIWSQTTGKHLNWLQPDKTRRTDYTVFEAKLKTVLERIKVAGARQPMEADHG